MTIKMTPIVQRVTEDKIELLFEGLPLKTYTRPNVKKTNSGEKSNPEVVVFEQLHTLATEQKWDEFFNAIRPNNNMVDFVHTPTLAMGLGIKNGRVTYQGFRVDNMLTKNIVKLLASKNRGNYTAHDAELGQLISFLGQLMNNPDSKVVHQLYDVVKESVMLDDNGIMITLYATVKEDGDFVSGKTWAMPRNMIKNNNEVRVVSTVPRTKAPEGYVVKRLSVNPANVEAVGSGYLVICAADVNETVTNEHWED